LKSTWLVTSFTSKKNEKYNTQIYGYDLVLYLFMKTLGCYARKINIRKLLKLGDLQLKTIWSKNLAC
jgi:hypothetical protein